MDLESLQARQIQDLYATQTGQLGQAMSITGIGTTAMKSGNIAVDSSTSLGALLYNPFTSGNYQLSNSSSITIPQEPKMRVIRYTVVDPDLNLLNTEASPFVMWDTTVVKGNDNAKFMMDLALTLGDDLKDYNESLKAFSWLDDENKVHFFKARKFSDLDVIIEVLKTYA